MKKAGYAETAQEAKEAKVPTAVANLEIVKIVREHIPIMADVYGSTFGELVDNHLRMIAEQGEEIQSFTFHIEPDMWGTYANVLLNR